MEILSKLQSFVGKKISKDEQASAEEPEINKATQKSKKPHFFVMQALEAVKKLELDGGTFICSSPDFDCYFKKTYMPLFEEKNAYIKVAFDKAENISHVCGLLPRLKQEKEQEKTEDEKMTLAKMPDCLLSQAIEQVSRAPITSRPGNVVNQGRTEYVKQQSAKADNAMYQRLTTSAGKNSSNILFEPSISGGSLKGIEKEWLNSMHASLVDSEYKSLLHLLQHLIIVRGFREKIEHFLNTKKELQPGSCSAIINAFKYLAREAQFNEQTISVAQIGSRLEQRFYLKPKENFSTIVELFFCLGYAKEIKGYTTGFIELS